MDKHRDIRIRVPVLARVEGEGALDIDISDNQVNSVKLKIYEPPRLFEKLLEGREYHEVADIVARICGICPVAYQISAIQALEQAFAFQPDAWLSAMRRVFYCGEWIQSHSLHIHLLAAPDFLGFSSGPEMAGKFPVEVRRGLRLQTLGNELISLFGARSVHPVGACVGGFHHAPDTAQVEALLHKLQNALPDSIALIEWTAGLPVPDQQQDFRSICLRETDNYPMIGTLLKTSDGIEIPIEQFEQDFREFQVPHSTAFHALFRDQPYLVGPLARLNNNLDRLSGPLQEVLEKTGQKWPSRNMFHSITARAVEIHYALTEAIRLLSNYRKPAAATGKVEPRTGIGYGCSEAPRGFLWHRYQVDNNGGVETARIVPPTSQNQARMEQDLQQSLQAFGLQHSDDELRLHAESVIRNYDPCISCATHFLTLKVRR